MIKSRRMRLAKNVARKNRGGLRDRILVGRSDGKKALEIPRRRWVDNIKMDLRKLEGMM
jgi:hypothetical protein